ncbi:MAG: HEAT repeat domain-containing protein [Cyclobacteriaceae bacterium]|nr:HEAT repeat domain-containing protein [Cyclobacteriaceae bacterium]
MKKSIKSIKAIQVILLLSTSFLFITCSESPSSLLKKRAGKVIQQIEDYRFGSSRAWLQEFQDVMAEVNNMPEIHGEVEKMMVKLLQSDASAEGKLIVCKFIGQVGSGYCIPTLQKMMLDPATQHMAIMALASLPVDEISQILIESLTTVDAAGKAEIAGVLSLKPDQDALIPLQALLRENDAVMKDAAAHAISAIGGKEAAEILRNEFTAAEGELKWKMAAYWLKALTNESAEAKLDACEVILSEKPPLSLLHMAIKMKLGCLPETEQASDLMNAFHQQDQDVQQMLVTLVRELPENADLSVFIQSLNQFPTGIQHQLMIAIADRNDPAIRPMLLAELNKISDEGRLMALRGLKNVANSRDLDILVRVAASGSPDEQELARSCIYWMNDQNTNGVILASAALKNSGEKAELLKAIGYRKIVSGKELIMANLQNPHPAIRNAAIVSLGNIGAFTDLESTLDLLITKSSPADYEAIQNAIISMAVSSGTAEGSADILTAKLATNPGTTASVILISALGELGGDVSLRTLRSYIDAQDADVQFAVLKALSNWKDDQPMADLQQILNKSIPPANRSQAIVGMVILTQNSKTLSGDLKVEKLQEVYGATTSTFDKKTLINGISRIYSVKALDFAISQVNESDVKQDAQEAVIRIAGDLRDGFHDEVKTKMEALLQQTEDADFGGRISTVLKSMEL